MRRSEIQFKNGSILRKEMLEEMYGYPKAALESYYASFGDGILYGLSWKEEAVGRHVICPGALKFRGEIYFQREPLWVEGYFQNHKDQSLETDRKYRLFFLPGRECEEPGRKVDKLELTLIQSDLLKEAMEKGYYYSYVSVDGEKGLAPVEDKNCLYGLYAGTGRYGYRLPLRELENLAPALEKKTDKHYLDYEILGYLYSGNPAPTELIALYVHEYLAQEGMAGEADTGSPRALMEAFRKAAAGLKNKQVRVTEIKGQREEEKMSMEEEIAGQGVL